MDPVFLKETEADAPVHGMDRAKTPPRRQDFCSGAVHRCIHSLAHIVEDHAEAAGVPNRFAATKLVEGDAPMLAMLHLSDNEVELIGHSVAEMEAERAGEEWRASVDEALCGLYESAAGGE